MPFIFTWQLIAYSCPAYCAMYLQAGALSTLLVWLTCNWELMAVKGIYVPAVSPATKHCSWKFTVRKRVLAAADIRGVQTPPLSKKLRTALLAVALLVAQRILLPLPP